MRVGPRRASPAVRVAIAAAALLAAVVLTLALRADIRLAPFVFFYASVAVAAAYCGVAGGAVATLVGLLVVDYYYIPPTGVFGLAATSDVVAVAAFVGVAIIVTGLAAWSGRARRVAEKTAAKLEERTNELETRQLEMENLAAELEQLNVEAEMATEDATEARNAAQASEERLRLLDEASRVLASSLDYQATISTVARLAVPNFADWCAVDVLEDGELKRLALEHADPAKLHRAREIAEQFPPSHDGTTGVTKVIRTGEPEFLPNISDEMLASMARSEQHLAAVRELGINSVIIVPMTARGQTLGAITLVGSRPDREFGETALSLARALGRRAAIAIDNARLYRAALVANEAKANFLATMSHELRTPLAAVIGYEELLVEGIAGSVNDAQRQQLERIKASAMRLLSLIDEILLFARIEAGREEVRIEPVDAKRVVDDAIAFVTPSVADRKDLKVEAEPVDPSIALQTDPGKLRRMLFNLLENAVKFTRSGRIAVRVRRHGELIDFEVQDTGIGVSRENQRLIFDPFWQVTQSTTRAAGGSGLGLSVTRRLAELLGGTVGVESEPGKGSTFRITLPRALRLVNAETDGGEQSAPASGSERPARP
ncbi:MAG TPA: ATP-binding protein [Gemmatimonadaceae bacterium]|nr:ATP-binding protein [Gemmatimonadaceae bacterium]